MIAQGPQHRLVGTSIARREDGRLLRGDGRFVADLVDRSTLHMAVLRSSESAGRVVELDTAAAEALPGVHGVWSGSELNRHLRPIAALTVPHPDFKIAFNLWAATLGITVCADEYVHYAGEPVAVIVASTRAVAEDGLELVRVAYEPAGAVTDTRAALAADSPLVHRDTERGNLAAELFAEFGDVDQARAAAAVTVSETYRVGRHGAVPIECRGVVAEWDETTGVTRVWTSTQVPQLVRRAISGSTGWPPSAVRVTVPDVGGGFGTKANVYPEEIICPYLARQLGRRIAWIEDRAEHLVAAAQGRDQLLQAALSVDSDGILLGLDVDYIVDIGANSLWTSGMVGNTALHLMGPYRLPAYRVRGRAAYTNKATTAQYRGAGRPEACFALERSIDAAADRLGIHRVEIRRRNILTAPDLPYPRPLPYRDGVPMSYDGGDYLACLDLAVDLLAARRAATVDCGGAEETVGTGVAAYLEATGRGPNESARVRLTRDGRFQVATGAASAGQSHETTLVQVAGDALGVGIDRVALLPSDTDNVDNGVGTFASRTAVVAGNAVRVAATQLRRRAVVLSAKLLEADEADIRLSDEGCSLPGREIVTWAALSGALAPGGALEGEGPLDVQAQFTPETVTWTMGVHAAAVAVNHETGGVRVLDYIVVHEGGVEINPDVVAGQIQGGVAQGIGGALLENFGYGADGQPQTSTLVDYKLPETTDIPTALVVPLHTDRVNNELGVKGVGESGTIAAYAVLASAIENATGELHGRITVSPITPHDVISLIDGDFGVEEA
jgi:carbon-monoxide dehydrogenase large subunit